MAPIFSITAEQISDLYQKNKTESIHLQQFNFLAEIGNYFTRYNTALDEPMRKVGALKVNVDTINKINALAFAAEQEQLWNTLKAMRSAILKATEELRAKDIIKRSLDARVTMFIDPKADFAKDIEQFFALLKKHGEKPEAFFKDFAILSQFALSKNKEGLAASSMPGLYLTVEKAQIGRAHV